MEEEKFEVERIIPVNIIEDKKQMRVAIPAEIIEDFGIDSKRNQFAWVVKVNKETQRVTINGIFTIKQNGKKKD